jgi:hypothetical protein
MAEDIQIELVDGSTYSVNIDHHLFAVTVDEVDVQELGGHAEQLVRASFAFLLEREPVTSILRNFDLAVIENYFPEWRAEMRKRLG